MSRSTLLGSAALVLLGGAVAAAPPAPSAAGIHGATVSAAPDAGAIRAMAQARPRAGAFITALNPDPRAAIPVRIPRRAEIKLPEAQEIVVYAPHRPVRIRLGVLYEGKPIARMWRERLEAAFAHFDRDKDGMLNSFETQNVFSDSGIVQMLQNGLYQPTPQDRPTLDRLDTDGDRKVSVEEYIAYYKSATAMMLRPQAPTAENPYNAATTESLFKMMDANNDGKLTRDEVKAIEAYVATKDSDEDECLSAAELIPNINNPRQFQGQIVLRGDGRPTPLPNTANQPVVTYEVGRIPGTLTQQVIRRYDKDGDFELTREEMAFDEPTFARLDADGNGRLDGEELDVWRTGPPDLEASLSLSAKAVDCSATLLTDAKEASARGFSLRQVEPGRLIVRAGRQPIELWAFTAVVNTAQQPALKTQYAYLFQQASGGKDHIVDKDLTGPNAVNFQFIRTLFDAADTNGDGKMTRAEFDAYFDLQDSFRNIALAITPAVQTPTLFQLLDENRDGRLGVRELRTAWDRLIVLEPNSTEEITRAAIQPSISLRLSRGIDRFYINQFNQQFVVQNQNQVQVPQKGPMWFRKMDRNADGDVSRSEFLGTRGEFDAIDADKDLLISLEEAEVFDRKMRPAEERKDEPVRK